MVEIEIHFTEYFDGETVVISSAGQELYRAGQLKTDMRTSLARIARVAVPPGRPTLTFSLPSRSITASAAIDVSGLKHVRVALVDGKLAIDPVSEEEFKREPRGFA
jgi:hypothetical protein